MNKIEMNIVEIQKKLLEPLTKAGWGIVFEPIIYSDSFQELIYSLKKEAEEGRRFTPPIKDLFRAFQECPYDKLNVMIIGQDPYPQLGVADGISFSCSKTMKEQPSLRYIFNYLETQHADLDRNPDLKRWSNQGVLMFNTALTVQVGKIGSHYSYWNKFTSFILDCINADKKDISVALLGKKAESWEKHLLNQKIYKVPHPASAAYKGGKWNAKNIFNNINEDLKNHNKPIIVW
jgi:uracil-DNA glycosylase